MLEQAIEPVVQTEAEQLAEMMAGYNKARGDEPPAVEPVTQIEPATPNDADEDLATEPQVKDPEPTVTSLADELKALKAKVAESSSRDPAAVRKLYGEIGNINRTLEALQSTPKEAPADDELVAALKSAEEAADEYPEVVGPLVKALKASIARQAQSKPDDIDKRVTTTVSRIREMDAREALIEEHPDFETVRDTPEYKSWLSSKPPEFQTRFNNTWNPAVVARGLTEFKDSLKKREQKQTRLASAVTLPSAQQRATSSVITDEQALMIGYQSGPKRFTNKR